MSDHPNVAQQGMPDLSRVSNKVWLDTLFWIERAEVGMKLALIDARFATLVDTHFDHREWTLDKLQIERRDIGATTTAVVTFLDAPTQWRPIATCIPPAGVIGFRAIYIWYVDVEVIAFLQHLRNVINRGVTLKFDKRSIHSTDRLCWALMSFRIWPMISNAITTISGMNAVTLRLLKQRVSDNVLLDCANLRSIIDSPVFPERQRPDRALQEENVQNYLFRWLHAPRQDDRPKVFTLRQMRKEDNGWEQLVWALQRAFEPGAIAVNYIVTFRWPTKGFVHFEKVNQRTGERLKGFTPGSYEDSITYKTKPFIVRCPIGTEQSTVDAWMREAEPKQETNAELYFYIRDCDIGPSLRAELQSNE